MFYVISIAAFIGSVMALIIVNLMSRNQALIQDKHELTVRLNAAQRTINEIDYQRRIGAKVPALYEVV